MTKSDPTVAGKSGDRARSGVSWVADVFGLGGDAQPEADAPTVAAAFVPPVVDEPAVAGVPHDPEPAPATALAPPDDIELAAAAQRSPAAAAPAAPGPTALERAWPADAEPAPERKRKLPPKFVLVIGAVALLLLAPLLFALSTRNKEASAAAEPEKLPTEMIVDERDIQNRVRVRPEDFHDRNAQPPAGVADQARRPEPLMLEQRDEAAALAERRAQRGNDPEDLIAHRAGGGARAAADEDGQRDQVDSGKPGNRRPRPGDEYRREILYLEPARSAAVAGGKGAASTLLAAGTVVPVTLPAPLRVAGGGTATIVVKVDADAALPEGSRIIGTATTDDEGHLTLRFTRLLWPERHEFKIEGEAQDADGAFGLQGVIASQAASEARSVASDVATDTATDVATDVLGGLTGGIGSSLARNLSSRTRGNRFGGSRSSLRVTLGAGAHFSVFFHEPVVDHD